MFYCLQKAKHVNFNRKLKILHPLFFSVFPFKEIRTTRKEPSQMTFLKSDEAVSFRYSRLFFKFPEVSVAHSWFYFKFLGSVSYSRIKDRRLM